MAVSEGRNASSQTVSRLQLHCKLVRETACKFIPLNAEYLGISLMLLHVLQYVATRLYTRSQAAKDATAFLVHPIQTTYPLQLCMNPRHL